MNNKDTNKHKKRFKKVYYVIQTVPYFKTCGHAFSRKTAQYVAQKVYQLTGEPGQIVEFTRQELKELGYKR